MIKTMYFHQFWPVILFLLTYVLEAWKYSNMPHMQLNMVWENEKFYLIKIQKC